MNTVIYLVRHGETQWAAEDRFSGVSDIPLTARGQTQATQLGQALSEVPFSAIYCSPLQRAKSTAEALNLRGLPLQLEPRLQEINYGVWEGMSRTAIQKQYADLYTAWGRDPVTLAPPDGETGQAVAERLHSFWNEVRGRHPAAPILVVAHKTINRISLCSFLNLPITQYRWRMAQSTCALNIIEWSALGVSLHVLNYTLDAFPTLQGH